MEPIEETSRTIRLYEKNKKYIKIFASYDKDEDGFTFGDRTMIPRGWIKKIQKI